MFFSLIQTLVCVLLVNGGLYALHLTGNSNGQAPAQQNTNNNQPHNNMQQLNKPYQTTNNRLNEELADLAQLERERLMVMGLVKQTAEESGYHGRPIITGRIKMHPAEDMDYSAWLNQQARNNMFGSVVTEPLNDEEDYDTGGGGGGLGSSVDSGNFDTLASHNNKYEYGRVVQPVESQRDFENPHNLNLDDFMELEPARDEEEMFPDLDGYAYIEDLMAEENKERLQHHYQQQQHLQIPQFPGFRHQQQQQQQQQQLSSQHHTPLSHSYQQQEPYDNQQTLKEFFEKEQKHQQGLNQQNLKHQQQQQQQQANQFNNKYRNNIKMQQKWLRKRNQMQQPQQLSRNIFGQKNTKQQHHFKTLTNNNNKLAMANSEATATTRVNNNNNKAENAQQQQHEKLVPKEDSSKLAKSSTTADAATSNSASTKATEKSSSSSNEQKPDLMLNSNHKRSGLTPAGLASAQGVSSPHSLASQLMLRTARGQRQYDVPQIECPTAMDGMERFACPTPDVQGRYRCIDDHVLCDGFIDCPEGEDEDRRSCMFYKTTKAHLDVLADALLRWARGR